MEHQAHPGQGHLEQDGGSTQGKEWNAHQIRTARPPAQNYEYCVECAIEFLATRRLHTSSQDGASLCDPFDLAKIQFEVNDRYSVLTLPFDLPEGLGQNLRDNQWEYYSYAIDPSRIHVILNTGVFIPSRRADGSRCEKFDGDAGVR